MKNTIEWKDIFPARERKTNCVKVCIRDDFGITKNPEIVP